MLAVATKWPNVYINLSAWMPKYLDPALVRFMRGRTGCTKVMFGSNGLSWARWLREFADMDIPEEWARLILRGNALRTHGLG